MLNIFYEYQDLLITLSTFSIVLFVVSVLLSPYLASKIPVQYFTPHYQVKPTKNIAIKWLKNTFGTIVLVLGVIMLVAPGQGILTILLGLFMMEFKAKRQWELTLVEQKIIFKSLNWLRVKNNHPPLQR